MEYFSQFKWALPRAFADALGQCQFGEGDILYPEKSAYSAEWDAKTARISLQVTYPPRQMNVPKEDTAEVFKKNWNSEVRLQKYICASSESSSLSKDGELITSTQGRLYTSLWKGSLNFLSADSKVSMPTVNTKEAVILRQVAGSKFKQSYIEQVQDTAQRSAKGETVFVMPYDPSNNVSSAKFEKIRKALKNVLSRELEILTPKEAGIDSWRLFMPTVYIALFVTKTSGEDVREQVKKATYVKAKNRKTDKDAYDIRKHGVIFD